MSEVGEEVKDVNDGDKTTCEVTEKEGSDPPTKKTEVESVKEKSEESKESLPSLDKQSSTEISVLTSRDDKVEGQVSPEAKVEGKLEEKTDESDKNESEDVVKEEPAEPVLVENDPDSVVIEKTEIVEQLSTNKLEDSVFVEEKEDVQVTEDEKDEMGNSETAEEETGNSETAEEEKDAEETFVDDDEQFSSAESEISKKSSGGNSRSSAVEGETEQQREDGDGEEEDKKDKKVDQAEDRRNPQYIPRRGVFYEHDDRTLDDETSGDKKEDEPPQKPNKKAASSDVVDKWGHDLFDEIMQSPKSTEELIDSYGYDIRKEDGPPKARRSRHYGKGPNKYQRNWEDEQAYNKSSGFRGSRKPPFRNSRPKNFTNTEEDFPSLSPGDRGKPERTENIRNDKSWSRGSNRDGGRTRQDARVANSVSNDYDQPSGTKQVTFRDRNASPGGRRGSNRFGGGEFRRSNAPVRTAQGAVNTGNKESSKDKFDNDDIAALAQHFSNAVINVDKKNIVPINKGSAVPAPVTTNSAPPQGSVPKSMVISSTSYSPAAPAQQPPPTETRREDRSNEITSSLQEKGEITAKSKRYSTQRQRSIPHQPPAPLQVSSTTGAAPPQLHPPATTSPNANYLPHPPPNFFPPPPPPTTCMEPPPFQAPPPPGAMVTFIPSVNPNQAYQPPPPQFIPHQFMAVPSHVTAGPPPPPPGAPPEVYQGGGITYYNTQSQIPPRQTPSRRIKLAIPIVAPDSQSIQ